MTALPMLIGYRKALWKGYCPCCKPLPPEYGPQMHKAACRLASQEDWT